MAVSFGDITLDGLALNRIVFLLNGRARAFLEGSVTDDHVLDIIGTTSHLGISKCTDGVGLRFILGNIGFAYCLASFGGAKFFGYRASKASTKTIGLNGRLTGLELE